MRRRTLWTHLSGTSCSHNVLITTSSACFQEDGMNTSVFRDENIICIPHEDVMNLHITASEDIMNTSYPMQILWTQVPGVVMATRWHHKRDDGRQMIITTTMTTTRMTTTPLQLLDVYLAPNINSTRQKQEHTDCKSSTWLQHVTWRVTTWGGGHVNAAVVLLKYIYVVRGWQWPK